MLTFFGIILANVAGGLTELAIMIILLRIYEKKTGKKLVTFNM